MAILSKLWNNPNQPKQSLYNTSSSQDGGRREKLRRAQLAEIDATATARLFKRLVAAETGTTTIEDRAGKIVREQLNKEGKLEYKVGE